MNKLKRTKIIPKFETIDESRLLSFLKKPELVPEPEPLIVEEAPIAAQEGGAKTPGKNKKVKKPVVKRPRAKPAKIKYDLSKNTVSELQRKFLEEF